jgi:acyl-coenzyme A thioesterase PaaI-like protein
MYLGAPCNQHDEPGIRISEGEAEIVIPIQDKFLDAAGFVHDSVYFRAMVDAARFAVSSVAETVVLTTVGFNFLLARPVTEGELIARGRFMSTAEDHYLAEAILTTSDGEEIGRANGAFVRTDHPLSAEMGYR